ncbi:MAG: DNA mismatch repair endonuclease MutL [Bacteroidota bacterium]|nr:DNA mismatch repair endonuclease MutL [Bacteroidota bacterium]
MSSIINILPEHLANKIAAGEVVQRPESVVKELLENSIDAGATSISITIKSAGKLLIQLIDNGKGMSSEDAVKSFYRHATSKISTYEDLENIRTLGFRGEALASIAAVAQVELKTRREEDEVGTLLRIEGTEIKEQTNVAHQGGTTISVKNLFYNTPARRQFLKSNNTEFKHIYDTIQRLALSKPEIALEFNSDDDVILALPSQKLDERLKSLFGDRHFATLIPLQEHTDLLTISGFIGKPDFARKSKVDQYIFLNNRFIINRSINHAVFSGYEHLVEKGNFPFFLLFIEVDPHKVDINVHPSKMEVKFADEQSIYRIVISVVRKTLGGSDIIPTVEFQRQTNDFSSLRHSAIPRFYSDVQPKPSSPFGFSGQNQSATFSNEEIPFDLNSKLDQIFSKLPDNETTLPVDTQTQFQHGTREFDAQEGKAIWQLHNKYILTQIRSGLMIIDQHVAHERILYERALTRMNNAVPSSQQLLFPQTIQLPAGDYTLTKDLLPFLNSIGFETKLFGKNTIVLEGVPPEVKAGTEANILQDILDEFKNNQLRVKLDARDNIAKSFSCKAAIKAGERLTETEMRSLIDQLFGTSMPYVCPHGRPVLIKLSLAELDRRFFRT